MAEDGSRVWADQTKVGLVLTNPNRTDTKHRLSGSVINIILRKDAQCLWERCCFATSCRSGMFCTCMCGFLCFKFSNETLSGEEFSKETLSGEAETREDRISQLPDDVISLIISRLTTRGAIRTSVLSRRWRHIFTFMNKVKFCCADVYDGSICNPGSGWSQLQRKFVERVDTFLQHHSGSKIMSFELVCCFRGCILDKFREWMNFVGTSGVEQLTLGFCCFNNLHLSRFPVFSTDFLPEPSSLKHLWLRGGSFLTPKKNALRVIELDRIAFTSEAVQCMLSNCSSLQLLNLRFCALPTKLLIHGPHLKLKSLMICHCENVKEIDLSATNLINLEIYNLTILKLSFSCVPLLQTLVIEFYGSKVAHYVFGKIAEDVPHLESMTFTTRASFFEGCKLDQVISKLSNLRHLVLILEYYNKLDLLELAVFLDSCPLLRKFQLSMVEMSTFNLKRSRERMVRRDTQLKEVELNGFSGTKYVGWLKLLIQGMPRGDVKLSVNGCKDSPFLRMLRLLPYKEAISMAPFICKRVFQLSLSSKLGETVL
ncbi:F-box/FBD/LRR-repeat protein At1g51370-like isoform X2 [Primulina huaijiensis]|uniref:F-box/FBD/LRR-repeat protein At1g51370-like isoform X2 n=1 Tax=Primulina huaijiensis TaxID=1492673 RepID=UPI003CC70B0A